MIATTVSSGAKRPLAASFSSTAIVVPPGGLGQQALGGGEQVDAGEDLRVAREGRRCRRV